MLLLIAFAFIGGVVTILSPCILPILPIVLSGSVTTGKKKPIGIVLGFILSFTFFTLFLTSIVKATGVSADLLRNLSVVILVIFGISLLIPQIQKQFEMLFSKMASKAPQPGDKQGLGGGLIIGFSIGLLWTPCVGPILASVISLALTGTVTGSALLITLAYSLGTALPMLMIMYGGRALLNKVPGLLNNTVTIQKVFGVLMIILAIAIYFNADRKFQTYILQQFPKYGIGLTAFEDNDSIQAELDKLDSNKRDNITNTNVEPDLESQGIPAPALIPGGVWLNSEPLTLEDLKGQVVLLDFMTYSCINCIRTFPYLTDWYAKYKDDGFIIIGIHTPEFEFEKNPDNVRKALEQYGIEYPVMQDNDYATWNAYGNRYWPREYLLDYKGNIVYDHIGEGNYDVTERNIQELLQQRNDELGQSFINKGLSEPTGDTPQAQSPETYFGAWRNEYLGNGESYKIGKQTFELPGILYPNTFYLEGDWQIAQQYATNISIAAKVVFKYTAKKMFLVAGSDETVKVQVIKNGEYLKTIEVKDQKLYDLLESDDLESGTLELIIESPGIQIFTFTFG